MNNTLGDLNNHLFEALERLNDAETPEEIEQEINRAGAVANIGEAIVKNAALGLKAVEVLGRPEIPDMLRLER